MTTPEGAGGLNPDVPDVIGATGVSGLPARTQDNVTAQLKSQLQGSTAWKSASAAVYANLRRGVPLPLAVIEAIVKSSFNWSDETWDSVEAALDSFNEANSAFPTMCGSIWAAVTAAGWTMSQRVVAIDNAWQTYQTTLKRDNATQSAGLNAAIRNLFGIDPTTGQISLNALGLLPTSYLITSDPNQLDAPNFDGAGSMQPGSGWTYDSTVYFGAAGEGSARCDADGTDHGMRSNRMPFTADKTERLSIEFLTDGLTVTSGTKPITLSVIAYAGDDVVETVLIDSAAAGTAAATAWTGASGTARAGTLSGPYPVDGATVPANVDQIEMRLGVTADALTGSVNFDNAESLLSGGPFDELQNAWITRSSAVGTFATALFTAMKGYTTWATFASSVETAYNAMIATFDTVENAEFDTFKSVVKELFHVDWDTGALVLSDGSDVADALDDLGDTTRRALNAAVQGLNIGYFDSSWTWQTSAPTAADLPETIAQSSGDNGMNPLPGGGTSSILDPRIPAAPTKVSYTTPFKAGASFPSGKVFYALTSVLNGVEGPPSAEVMVDVLGLGTATITVDLSWPTVSGVDSTNIYRRIKSLWGDEESHLVGNTTSNAFSDSTVRTGGTLQSPPTTADLDAEVAQLIAQDQQAATAAVQQGADAAGQAAQDASSVATDAHDIASGAAATLAVRPAFMGVMDSLEAVFPISQMLGASTPPLEMSTGTSLRTYIGFIRCQHAETKTYVAFQAKTNNAQSFTYSVWSVDPTDGTLSLLSRTQYVFSPEYVSSQYQWFVMKLDPPVVVNSGDIIAVSVDNGPAMTFAGMSMLWLAAHPFQHPGHLGGTSQGAISPPGVPVPLGTGADSSSYAYTGNVPWFALGSGAITESGIYGGTGGSSSDGGGGSSTTPLTPVQFSRTGVGGQNFALPDGVQVGDKVDAAAIGGGGGGGTNGITSWWGAPAVWSGGTHTLTTADIAVGTITLTAGAGGAGTVNATGGTSTVKIGSTVLASSTGGVQHSGTQGGQGAATAVIAGRTYSGSNDVGTNQNGARPGGGAGAPFLNSYSFTGGVGAAYARVYRDS